MDETRDDRESHRAYAGPRAIGLLCERRNDSGPRGLYGPRDVDLADVRLKGARWTSGTVWPGHAAPEIVKMSTETAPGIFQIDFPSKGEIPALSPAAG